MTSIVNEIIVETVGLRLSGALATALPVVVTLFLLVLLVLKEVIRILNLPRAKVWMQALDIAIVPLLVAFGFVAIARLIRF